MNCAQSHDCEQSLLKMGKWKVVEENGKFGGKNVMVHFVVSGIL